MRVKIGNHVYDTSTSKFMGDYLEKDDYGTTFYYALYRTRRNGYFEYREAYRYGTKHNAMSIVQLTTGEAEEWMKRHLD